MRGVAISRLTRQIICLKDKCACGKHVEHGRTGILKELLRFTLFNS
jgi:hypothetical protein